MGLGITVEADVSDLCGGDQGKDAADHSQACAQDRDNGELSACNHGRHGLFQGRLDLNVFGLKVCQGFIAHQHTDLLDHGTEFVGSCRSAAEHGDLVLYQRMIVNKYLCHNCLLLYMMYSVPPG